jgi:hypothetical protein
MTANGLLYADGSGIRNVQASLSVASATLNMQDYGINTSSAVNAGVYQISGSTVLAVLPGSGSFAAGPGAGAANSGSQNSFFGSGAGNQNQSGGNNSFFGYYAGGANISGGSNACFGGYAGTNIVGGSGNVAVGYSAGYLNASGSMNVFIGNTAGYFNTGGNSNIVIGAGQNTSAPAAGYELNIGGLLFGDLAGKTIGISTRAPQAALDVVSTGTAPNVYAQIWRNSNGVIVASMSSTGLLYPGQLVNGDNLGNHIATQNLNMSNYNILAASAVSAGIYQINGSTALAMPHQGETVLIGPYAGDGSSASFDVTIGYQSGRFSHGFNTFVGYQAGGYNAGSGNTIIGYQSGQNAQTMAGNTLIGYQAAGYPYGSPSNQTYSSNTVVGTMAGYQLTGNSNGNTLLGTYAGYSITTGTGNIVIGMGQDVVSPAANSQINIGGVYYGDIAGGTASIGLTAVNDYHSTVAGTPAKLMVNGSARVNGPVELGDVNAVGPQPVVVWLQNNYASTVSSGTVVIASGGGFVPSTAAAQTSVIGVVYEPGGITAGTYGRVAVAGVISVQTNTAVNAGEHVISSSSAGLATSTSTPTAGASLGVWLAPASAGWGRAVLR